jgi:hypothetical protein
MGWDPAPRFTRIQALRLSRNIEALNLSRIRDRSLQNARFRKSGTLRSPSYGGGGEESCLKKRFLRTIWSHHFSSSILSNPIFFSFPFPFFSHHQTGQGDLAWKRCFSNPAPRKGKPPPPLSPPLPSPVGNERLELSCAKAAGKCGNSSCGCGGIKEGTA